MNIYFSTVENETNDADLFDHILPDNPSKIERRRDLFLILGFNKNNGKLTRMILFKQRGEKQLPVAIWRNEMFVN
jgi:hypothetical protein